MQHQSSDKPNILEKIIPILPLSSNQPGSPALPTSGGSGVDSSNGVSSGGGSEFLYKAAEKIYPRSVHGLFARLRWLTVILTQCVFYGLPWLEWGQRQAVLFDLGARRFYLFGVLLYPQDFIYLTGLLIILSLIHI